MKASLNVTLCPDRPVYLYYRRQRSQSWLWPETRLFAEPVSRWHSVKTTFSFFAFRRICITEIWVAAGAQPGCLSGTRAGRGRRPCEGRRRSRRKRTSSRPWSRSFRRSSPRWRGGGEGALKIYFFLGHIYFTGIVRWDFLAQFFCLTHNPVFL